MYVIPLLPSKPLPDVPSPVLDRERRPTVDKSAEIAGVGLVAKSAEMPDLPAEKLSAPYAALGSVGRAISQAGGALGALVVAERRAEADIQISEADNAMEGIRDRMTVFQMENADPSTWKPEADRLLNGLRTQISENSKLNPLALNHINDRLGKFEQRLRGDVEIGSVKKKIDLAKSSFVARRERAIDNQNPEEFNEVNRLGVERGYWYEHEAVYSEQRFKETGERKLKETRAKEYDDAQNYIIAIAGENGEEAARTTVDGLDNRFDEADKERLRGVAGQVARDRQGQVIDFFSEGIASGAINSEEAIDAVENPHITPVLRAKAKESLASFNSEQALREREERGVENAVALRIAARDYNPREDPTGEKYFTLRQTVYRNVPEGLRNSVLDTLEAKYSGKSIPVDATTRGYVESTLGVMFDPKGGTIPWRKETPVLTPKGKPVIGPDGNPKTEIVEDLKEKQRAIDVQARVERDMNEWLQRNPNATLPEIKKQIIETLPNGTRAGALQSIIKAAGVKAAEPTAALGNVTSYGYPGDTTPDSNSKLGIGAFVPQVEQDKIKRGEFSEYKLQRGDIAVSPDIEAQFRAAGIGPMDYVMVKLENGEVRQGRWMDKTAQDEDILAGRVRGVTKPLRGRFDFYSPKRKDYSDGAKVVKWWKLA